MTHYRVRLRRESEQEVEFDTADFSDEEKEAGPVQAAIELADSAGWWSDGDEVDGIEVSDDGETWRRLPMSEVLRLERA